MSTALEIANACVPSAESELPIMPHARAILVGVARDRIQAALDEARRKAIEQCAAIAKTYGGDCDLMISEFRALLSET